MFGLSKHKSERRSDVATHKDGETKSNEKPTLEVWASYCGGHKAHPSETTCKLKIFADSIEITKPAIIVSFAQMASVEYTKTPKISAFSVGTRTFTVVEYNDGIDSQALVLHIANVLGAKHADKAHGMIYEGFRRAKSAN